MLRPCSACARHVRPALPCPFCGAPPAPEPVARPALRVVGPVGRAVLFLGAALLAPACGDDDGGADAAAATDTGVAMDAGRDAAEADAGPSDAAPVEEQTLFPPYGAPPEELSRLV